MVWKTNFDRHLDEFVLSHIEKGETQLQHETQIFASTPPSGQQQKKVEAKVQAAKKPECWTEAEGEAPLSTVFRQLLCLTRGKIK